MKKIFIIFIVLLIALMVVILSAVNSSYVIAKIADEYAPDYNISYDKISGNIFTGIEVKNLKYANQ
ncbi:MAG: hypothetical protein L3J43_10560, partial [Sulfurovum sp.]|nr:hypothetical protein [Sulfurovum sp.]